MRRGIARFIPIIFFIVIFILIIAAGVSVVRLFTGNDEPTTTVQDEPANKGLLSTEAGRSVVMRLRGNIVGNEDFRSYEVTISPNAREFTRSKGYLKTSLVDKTYDNNVEAYDQFVHALANAKFATGVPLSGEEDDTRGLCATGILYEFEVKNGDKVEKRLWTTTCKGSKGSLKANADQLRELFLAQVPDATKYIGEE